MSDRSLTPEERERLAKHLEYVAERLGDETGNLGFAVGGIIARERIVPDLLAAADALRSASREPAGNDETALSETCEGLNVASLMKMLHYRLNHGGNHLPVSQQEMRCILTLLENHASGEPAPREPSEAAKRILAERLFLGTTQSGIAAMMREAGELLTTIYAVDFPPTRDPGSLTIREVP